MNNGTAVRCMVVKSMGMGILVGVGELKGHYSPKCYYYYLFNGFIAVLMILFIIR